MKNFLLVEDHPLMQKGIIKTIEDTSEFKCVGSAADFDQAIKLFEQHDTTIPCIMDLNLGKDSGLYLTETVSKKFKNIKIIVYSMYATCGIINQVMENGVCGYVSKSADESELIAALNAVLAGQTYIEKNLLNGLYTFKSKIELLTKREREVFDFILENKTNEEIADFLGIEKRAIENYTSRIYSKINVGDRNELIKKYGM